MRQARRLAIALTVAACADGTRGTQPIVEEPPPPATTAVSLRATVDATTGTMTFESLAPPGAVTLAGIYGNQGVTVRLYNSPVVVTTDLLGKKTFRANVGLRNLLPFPIGDEQGGPSPSAIRGIYVFVTSGPTVTATSIPCLLAPCTVRVQNHHGTLSFDAPDRRYWYWPERVGAAGGGADTTQSRVTWVFEADAPVTAFQFDVLVSAAWPPPHDTRWRSEYTGDSLPDLREEPRWGLTNTSGIFTTSGGFLNITTFNDGEIEFYRLDSLASTTSAYAEARVRFNSTGERGRAVVHFGDGVKYVALGIHDGGVGFVRSSTTFPFIASWPVETNVFRTYQLRKYAADSAVIYVDGGRIGAVTYASLSSPTVQGTRFQFGSPRVAGTSNADWDYVIFEIGVPQP